MSVSKTLQERFAQYFHFFDLDKDGVLTKKDFDMQIQNIQIIYDAGEEETERLKKIKEKFWETFDQFAVDGKLTEDAFIQAHSFLFDKGLAEDRKELFMSLFGMVDRNKDNKLSLREFLLYYKIFNVTNLDQVEKIFKRLDVQDKGFLTREEWVSVNVKFFVQDDPKEDFGFIYRNLKK